MRKDNPVADAIAQNVVRRRGEELHARCAWRLESEDAVSTAGSPLARRLLRGGNELLTLSAEDGRD